MFTRRHFNTLALSATAGSLLRESAFAQSKLRIAFANYSDEAVFGAAVLRGLQSAAKKRSEMDVQFFDNRQDPAKTIENARTIVSSKPDIVLWYSTFSDVNKRAATLFDEAKLKVIAIQSPVPGAPLFTVDNPLSGAASGKALADEFRKRFPDAAPEALVLGWPEQGALFIERAAATVKSLREAYPNIKIEEFSTNGDPNRARQLTADFLTRRPGAKAMIWAHVDAMGIASLAASRNARREGDVVIATTGGDQSAFPEIRRASGAFIGSFSFFPEYWGDDLLELASGYSKGQRPADRVSPRKQLFITAANINEFYPQ